MDVVSMRSRITSTNFLRNELEFVRRVQNFDLWRKGLIVMDELITVALLKVMKS